MGRARPPSNSIDPQHGDSSTMEGVKTKGKRVAIVFAAITAVLLGGAVFFFRKPLIEQWYLWKFRSEDFYVRLDATVQLRSLQSERVIPLLIEMASSDPSDDSIKNRDSRFEACAALGGFGPRAREAVPLMIRISKEDIYPPNRLAATVALEAIGETAAAADATRINGWKQ